MIKRIRPPEWAELEVYRNAMADVVYQELEYYGTEDKKVLGMIALDKIDSDYSVVVFMQGVEDSKDLYGLAEDDDPYRAIDLRTSIDSLEKARENLRELMNNWASPS